LLVAGGVGYIASYPGFGREVAADFFHEGDEFGFVVLFEFLMREAFFAGDELDENEGGHCGAIRGELCRERMKEELLAAGSGGGKELCTAADEAAWVEYRWDNKPSWMTRWRVSRKLKNSLVFGLNNEVLNKTLRPGQECRRESLKES
jgi:hypothetical protein